MNKFIPKKYKYVKIRKKLKYTKKTELKHTTLKLGTIGLKSVESSKLSSTILEIIRRIISRRIKKIGKVVIYAHCNVPLTKKSSGVRMGKGKGSLDQWIIPIKKGKIFIELLQVPRELGISVLKSVSSKLPMKTKIVNNFYNN